MSNIQGASDEDLKRLANSRVGERKKAFVAEILRRRREANWNAWVKRHPYLAAIFSPFKLFRRGFWR